MEPFYILLAFGFFFGPLILSITCWVQVSSLRKEIREMRADPRSDSPQKVASPPPVESPLRPPLPSPQPPRPPPVTAPLPSSATAWDERLVGGKLASFAGIALLLIGIALFVGYAIRNAWFGPGARVLIGLLTGGAMAALGHLAEVRGKGRLHLLARILTGGGTGLFYFCVFAAHGMYAMIPAGGAALGLAACAAATFGLAWVYGSQSIATLGVLGAFLLPVFLPDALPDRRFLLSYLAAINVPVILLGRKRDWQVLYNLAFVFSLLGLLAEVLRHGSRTRPDLELLGFGLLFFLQFAALGLLKLRGEPRRLGRTADTLRLLLNSAALTALCYWVLEKSGSGAWTGAAFLGLSLLHLLLSRLAWQRLALYTQDHLALLFGALTCASLALPIQLDGAWVSIGWSIQGAILCLLALRARIPLFQTAAMLLGFLGLTKGLLFDLRLYADPPALFLNARFISTLISAGLLGLQGQLQRRLGTAAPAGGDGTGAWLHSACIYAVLTVLWAEVFWTLESRQPAPWLLSSFFLLAAGWACGRISDRSRNHSRDSRIMLSLFPLKLLLDTLMISGMGTRDQTLLFLNAGFVGLALLALGGVLLPRLWGPRATPTADAPADPWPSFLHFASLAAAILALTTELYRIDSDWRQTWVTLAWSGCAMAFVVHGLARRRRGSRRAGLLLFALTTGKVLLVDLSELRGLDRITAFLVAGALLLLLSFLYQRAAEHLGENSP